MVFHCLHLELKCSHDCYLSEGLKWQSFPLLTGEQVHVVTDFLAQKFCNEELRMKVANS